MEDGRRRGTEEQLDVEVEIVIQIHFILYFQNDKNGTQIPGHWGYCDAAVSDCSLYPYKATQIIKAVGNTIKVYFF